MSHRKSLSWEDVHRLSDVRGLSGRTLVGESGRLGRLLFLSGVNIFPLDDDEVLQVYRGITNLLSRIPEGYGLQFRVELRHGQPGALPGLLSEESKRPPEIFQSEERSWPYQALADDRRRDFLERPARRRKLFLGIIRYADHERERLRLSFYPRGTPSNSLKKIKDKTDPSQEHLRALRDLEDALLALLPGAGMEGIQPSENEILCHLAERANPGLFVFEPFRMKGSDKITPLYQTTFQEFPGEIRAYRPDGSVYWGRFHALRQLPSSFHRESLSSILEGPDFDCDLTLNLFKPERSLVSRSVQSNSTVNRFLTLLLPGISYRLESVISEQESFLRALHDGVEEESSPILSNLTLGYWHADRRSLGERGMKTLRYFGESEGAVCAHEPFRQWPLFRSQFLLDGDANDRWEILTSTQAARFLPVWDRIPDQESPWFLTKNHRQEIVGLNFWSRDLPNSNGLVIGRSGSGKSFGVKLLLSQYLTESTTHQAIVVENGGDFERLTKFLGGDYVRIDLSGSFSLNPFPLRADLLTQEDEYDPDWMGFLVALIETFLVSSQSVLPVHRSILAQCLGDLYDRLPDPDRRPCLTDLVRTLFAFRGRDPEDEECSQRMAKTLESWATGLYAPLFNNPSGFSSSSRLLTFDLSGLDRQEALRGIVFAYIAGISMERLFKEKERRLYFIYDEAHRLMTQFRGSGFLEHMYRTARKFGGGVVAMSQSPEDWLGEGKEGGILGNTSWKWIFPCSVQPETYRRIGLSEREIAIIEGLEFVRGDYAECYMTMGRRRGVLRLETSPLEYLLAARSPWEDEMIDQAVSGPEPFQEGILRLAHKRWEDRETEEESET